MFQHSKNKNLSVAIQDPIQFKGGPPRGGVGYEAIILQEVCEAILIARDMGELRTEQELRYAHYADMLTRAFAREV